MKTKISDMLYAVVDCFEKNAFNLKNPDDSDLIGKKMIRTLKIIPGVKEVKQKTGLPGSGPKDGVDVFFQKTLLGRLL